MRNPDEAIQIVIAYLESAFRESVVDHEHHFDSGAETFRVDLAGTIYLLRVSHEFLSDFSEAQSQQRLKEWQVAEHMCRSADRRADLRRDGIITAIPHRSPEPN